MGHEPRVGDSMTNGENTSLEMEKKSLDDAPKLAKGIYMRELFFFVFSLVTLLSFCHAIPVFLFFFIDIY